VVSLLNSISMSNRIIKTEEKEIRIGIVLN